ncbi:hypothetical protein SAMN05216368_101412 [Cryobacterium flavum]|uniref:Uncharacterized protein n=1 Tax=Cryobacterium flavum TaxID=1424659 RepID=A0A4R8V5R6_9MICO|nr:hypothetical protein [Cryobacterium flavum]TFB77794.1 hypothetical protein E3O21_09100 [Cryobacterium flavum]SDM60119.1 hypothetical protein SAMN05216368_101412 [Cryobacterium flavum]
MTVDPNNDARYQRGYEPAAQAAAAASDRLAPTSNGGPAASAAPTETASVPAPEAAALLDQFEPRNPFVVALWVVGPALTIGGLSVQVRTFLDSMGGSSYINSPDGEVPFDMLLQQISWSLGPAMTSTGLATVVGLLFYHALRWRSRPSRRSDT